MTLLVNAQPEGTLPARGRTMILRGLQREALLGVAGTRATVLRPKAMVSERMRSGTTMDSWRLCPAVAGEARSLQQTQLLGSLRLREGELWTTTCGATGKGPVA
jgi:hypothetical protein